MFPYDYRMMDGRNPYGARGGYVRDSRGGRDYNYTPDYGDMDYSRRGGRYDMAQYDGNDYGMDYARHNQLDERTLEMWTREMMQEIEPVHHAKFKMDAIVKKAEEMGIRFEKFTPQQFYATVIMLVSDFGKTLGMTNVDIYTRLAKDWLCDPDAGVRYGEKLAAYYNNIANV